MKSNAAPQQMNNSRAAANGMAEKRASASATGLFLDTRPGAIAQRKLQEMATALQETGKKPGLLQRKKNEMITSAHPWPTMKQEIKSQYQSPNNELEELWSKGKLLNIDKFQEEGLPYHSQAKVSSMQGKDRPNNPINVSIHGEIGINEAGLRGNIEGKPYDGGHLIAFSVMGKEANTYTNVAPQGKKLNNGPFSLWEDKVLGGSVNHTQKMLEQLGVKDPPFLFDYDVFVTYPMSHYEVPKRKLVESQLAPESHLPDMPESFRFFKRIPQHWSAHAQPLALPPAEELNLRDRPDTPFIFGESSDYGIVKEGMQSNQKFSARGPKSLVEKLNYGMEGELSEGTIAKIERAPDGLRKNPAISNFSKLQGDDAPRWLVDDVFFGVSYSREELTFVLEQLKAKSSKLFNTASELRLINSIFKGVGPAQVAKDINAILKKEKIELERNILIEIIEASLTLIGAVKGMLEEKKKPPFKKQDANSLDFTSAERLPPQVSNLPDYAALRFEADDTQPD